MIPLVAAALVLPHAPDSSFKCDGGRTTHKAKEDLAALQGCWVLKTAEWCGLRCDQDPADQKTYHTRTSPVELTELPRDLRNERTTLKIVGASFVWRHGIAATTNGGCIRKAEETEGTIVLDTSRKLPVMTRQLVQPFAIGGEKTYYAVYTVKGDTLRLAMEYSNDPKKLPAAFVTDNNQDVVVLTFKRERH
jgi:uncharacterized protein (TIGR03067 family)